MAQLVPFVIEQDNASGLMSYWRGGGHQSEADRDGVSLAEYIHAIYGLLRQAKARDVLMIGCGGGTLATMLRRAGVNVTIVDNDPASFEIARLYFALSDDIECHIADGARFLRRKGPRYDAIVLDAFDGQQIPRHLTTPAFFAAAKARMRRGSLFLMNLIVADDDDLRPDRLAATMRGVWRDVRLLDRPDWIERNAVAMAGSVRSLRKPRLLMTPRRRAKSLAAGLKTMAFRAIRQAG